MFSIQTCTLRTCDNAQQALGVCFTHRGDEWIKSGTKTSMLHRGWSRPQWANLHPYGVLVLTVESSLSLCKNMWFILLTVTPGTGDTATNTRQAAVHVLNRQNQYIFITFSFDSSSTSGKNECHVWQCKRRQGKTYTHLKYKNKEAVDRIPKMQAYGTYFALS